MCAKRLILVGPMGSGKTSIAREIAFRVDLPLIDLDDEIVREVGFSIPEIFEREGETAFRYYESRVLKNNLSEDAIIATGGGIITTPENCELLKKDAGFVVYLLTSVENQFKHTRHDANRPLIKTQDRKKRLQELFNIRDPIYREVSNFILDTQDLSIKQCAQRIISEFDGYCNNGNN